LHQLSSLRPSVWLVMHTIVLALCFLASTSHGTRGKASHQPEPHKAFQQNNIPETISPVWLQIDSLQPSRKALPWKLLALLFLGLSQPTVGFRFSPDGRGLVARNQNAVTGKTHGFPSTGRSQPLTVAESNHRLGSMLRMKQEDSSEVFSERLWKAGQQLRLDQLDLPFSGYVGEISYTVVESYERGAKNFGEEREGQSGTSFPGIGTPRFQAPGLVKQRLFTVNRYDPSMRAAGKDVRLLLREFSATDSKEVKVLSGVFSLSPGDKEISELVGNEIKVLSALADASRSKAPFTKLVGSLSLAMQLSKFGDPSARDIKLEKAWINDLGTEPPRLGARWLVYEYDGLSTAAAFSVPTDFRVFASRARRSLSSAPAPLRVSWDQAARFVVKGIIRQTLEALAFVHDAGYAHRSLSPASIILSARQQDKGQAVSRCEASLLVLKLQNFAFATPISDNSPKRRESAERWKINRESVLDRTALSVAEDLSSAGYVFLSVLLGALAEPEPGADPSGPERSREVFERQIEDIYEGDVCGQFRDYLASEPAWKRVSAFLDANLGWDFLETLLLAREAAASTSDSFSYLTAQKMLNHPFLK